MEGVEAEEVEAAEEVAVIVDTEAAAAADLDTPGEGVPQMETGGIKIRPLLSPVVDPQFLPQQRLLLPPPPPPSRSPHNSHIRPPRAYSLTVPTFLAHLCCCISHSTFFIFRCASPSSLFLRCDLSLWWRLVSATTHLHCHEPPCGPTHALHHRERLSEKEKFQIWIAAEKEEKKNSDSQGGRVDLDGGSRKEKGFLEQSSRQPAVFRLVQPVPPNNLEDSEFVA
ncbi:hypothetical protein TEA_025525 [Camellia sinensis var. sinensis]|uniref:Uncharacterized protein n=1 Tax=Camellia sinensis var. sinensis TaxID=542762 RepID=A0A4S4DVP8_CAMSN|nr:hypothetical protein TEA_025525 [Camellia sinensis var. sinensis]